MARKQQVEWQVWERGVEQVHIFKTERGARNYIARVPNDICEGGILLHEFTVRKVTRHWA